MWKLRLYLSQLLFLRWIVTTIGLVLLVGLLDSLANANEIASTDGGGALRYMSLRAPIIFDQVFLFTVMLALLLTYVSLIQRNELVALQGFGLSLPAQIRMFAPVVLMIGIVSAVFINQFVPSSVRALNDWGVGEYEGGNISEDEPLWLNDNGTFVSIAGRENSETLTDLTFFRRNEGGDVEQITWAERASYNGDSWNLTSVRELVVEGEAEPTMTQWITDQRPSMIDRLAAEPRDLSIADLGRFERLRGSGSRPSSAYQVWRLTRLSLPLTAFALLLVAVPMMQRLGRRESGTGQMVITLGMTFLFMVFDGITKTLGAAGAMSPWLAAFGISVGFGLFGLYMTLRQETLSV